MTSRRIATLDGIRGLAILLVLAGHIATNYQPLDENLRRWLTAFANAGGGVRLFFVLSGYLITQLLLAEQTRSGTISLRQFYKRRALRIFPAFYVYLIVLLALGSLVSTGLTPSTFTAAATFTWNYGFLWVTYAPEGFWYLGHLWTLALEQQFYLLWPLALLALGVRHATWVALALLAWCPLARLGAYFLFPAQRGNLGSMFHTGIDVIMVGCAAALLLHRPVARDFLHRHARRGAWIAATWLCVLSPLAAELRHGFPLIAGYTLDAIAAAWLIAWAHHCPSPLVEKFLGHGPLPWLGLISYSLYLWQQLFLSPTGPLREGRIVLPLAAATLAAVLSYYLVEQTALHFKSASSRPTAAP